MSKLGIAIFVIAVFPPATCDTQTLDMYRNRYRNKQDVGQDIVQSHVPTYNALESRDRICAVNSCMRYDTHVSK